MRRQGYKWYYLFAVSIIVFAMMYYLLIPAINYLFVSAEDNTILLDKLKEWIPDKKMEDAISEDLLLFSWDINNRQPYIVSKKNLK